jgi:hypothetical protein
MRPWTREFVPSKRIWLSSLSKGTRLWKGKSEKRMANCGPKFFIQFLKSEYGVSREGPIELADTLRNQVKTTLRESQIQEIEESKRLKGLSDDILYAAAKALYIDQDFKKEAV